MRYGALAVAILITGFLTASTLIENHIHRTDRQAQDLITVLRPVPATLNEENLAPVIATESKIKKDAVPFEFTRAQFINENCGWAMNRDSLFRTTDAGKNWEKLPQGPEKDAYFTSFTFVDESHGWLVAVKHDSAERYGVGISSVIMATDDGGRSWKLQANFPDEVQIRDICFRNEKEGLAVGFRGLDKRPDRGELFMVGTSNGGKEWTDVSGPAKAAFKNQWGVANEAGTYLQWTPSSLFMVTQGARVMNTTDEGKTWNTVAIFKHERPDGLRSTTSFHKVALDPRQRLRVVAGARGEEGYWGDFVINEDGRWTSYELPLTPIFDAVFLSDNDVLACGLKVERRDSKRPDGGVVLRSFDGGHSWQTVYRTKSFETFFYLTKIKNNDFYAVSDTGTFLHFSLPQ
jgi:photosystem II stability/assembly factor-like uncharacterized protein